MESTLKLGVLTLSDSCFRGDRIDTSGPAIEDLLSPFSPEIVEKAIIPDDLATIESTLMGWVQSGRFDLIITTGGTGVGPRDVTPEATRTVIDKEIPGLAEFMRSEGLKHTPMAVIGRGLAGIAGETLIINLPGSEQAVRENLGVVLPVLQHILNLISGETDHSSPEDGT
jgi:molybdenum cofactor synthesis domain-containing protein